MIIINEAIEINKYYNKEKNTYVFNDDVTFEIDIDIDAHMIAKKMIAKNIDAWNIYAKNIDALDINALDINAWNINAWNIDAKNIDACDMNVYKINVLEIDACDIKCIYIIANNINCDSMYLEHKKYKSITIK